MSNKKLKKLSPAPDKTYFSEDHPLRAGDQIHFEGSFLIRGKKTGSCWNCGLPTLWIDGNFMTRLCSEECERDRWKEYNDECIRLAKRDGTFIEEEETTLSDTNG